MKIRFPDLQRAGLLLALLCCMLAPASAIMWTVRAATTRTNELAARQEERLANKGFELRQLEIRKTVMTETVWDQAVKHLDLAFDREWAEANMAAFFTQTSRYELVFVIDAGGTPVLRHASGTNAERAWSIIQPQVAAMTRSIRARERTIRRPALSQPAEGLISTPIDATTAVRIDGVPYLLVAALVQPDFGETLPSARAPIVVVGEAIDQGFIDAFASAYLLRGPHLITARAEPEPGRSVLSIEDADGAFVAGLAWKPESPAGDLLDHLAGPLTALLFAMVLLPVGFYAWERRRWRQLRHARDAAEAASIAKSQFLANMSHEIRTPLNGVLGVAGALARTALAPNQREMIQLIDGSARSLEALLTDILDLARVESGALTVQSEPFDLVTTVKACAALFEAAASAKGLALDVSVSPEAAGVYEGDAPRLRQILSNLLSNAVKFTATGGVSLSVSAFRGETTSHLAFEVRDTGIGFDRETGARLFSRFEQGDGTITRRFGGSGLGLSISRALAKAMGGELTATSAPGLGSVFTLKLDLPRCESPVELWGARTTLPTAPDRRLRVLVAEDHPTNRRVVELILEAVGVELTCVENGAQAVEIFGQQIFDLVLMDMQMPVMDGLTAIRRIRALETERGARPTPIHVLTANAMPEHVRESEDAGADGHLPKPITPDRLLELVASVAETLPDGAKGQTNAAKNVG